MEKKTRFSDTLLGNNVPNDLLTEILSLVPVKSLVRFRCVSKSWKTMINDPDFARLHLNRFNNQPRYESRLFFTQDSKHESSECIETSIGETLRITNILGLLQSHQKSLGTLGITLDRTLEGFRRWFVRCSADGLFLLTNHNQFGSTMELMLWNPSIRKTLILPHLPEICSRPSKLHLPFGIGFDPLIKDYKFVGLFISATSSVCFIGVYTLGANSWKIITNSFPEDISYFWRTRAISFRGGLYFLAKKKAYSTPMQFVTFDLSSEMFASTGGLPEVGDLVKWVGSQDLTVIDGGCTLALVNFSNSKGSIWALENFGADIIKSSMIWTQRYTFTIEIPGFKSLLLGIELVSIEKNGEMLLRWPDMVTSYNLETHKEKILLRKELKDGQPYIESLILL